jgi:hypothetical protein
VAVREDAVDTVLLPAEGRCRYCCSKQLRTSNHNTLDCHYCK